MSEMSEQFSLYAFAQFLWMTHVGFTGPDVFSSLSHIVPNSPVSSNSWFPLVPSLIGAICHKVQTASVHPIVSV